MAHSHLPCPPSARCFLPRLVQKPAAANLLRLWFSEFPWLRTFLFLQQGRCPLHPPLRLPLLHQGARIPPLREQLDSLLVRAFSKLDRPRRPRLPGWFHLQRHTNPSPSGFDSWAAAPSSRTSVRGFDFP
ncbi:hypothetical protein BS78_07G041000 [Paspalum vaginatum]|nr:hypothetical protein BS78_07G041000 [Paspalum vaginatum]